jgi:hypothetical protein
MKRLDVNRWHEKLVLAAIILSCGLVMQADPPMHKTKLTKGSELGRNWKSDPAAVPAAHPGKTVKAQKMREAVAYR